MSIEGDQFNDQVWDRVGSRSPLNNQVPYGHALRQLRAKPFTDAGAARQFLNAPDATAAPAPANPFRMAVPPRKPTPTPVVVGSSRPRDPSTLPNFHPNYRPRSPGEAAFQPGSSPLLIPDPAKTPPNFFEEAVGAATLHPPTDNGTMGTAGGPVKPGRAFDSNWRLHEHGGGIEGRGSASPTPPEVLARENADRSRYRGGLGGIRPRQPTGPIGMASQPTDPTAAMRQWLTESIQKDVLQAQASGDQEGVAHHMGRFGALQSGGFVGHDKYLQDAAMNRALRAEHGSKGAMYDAKSGTALLTPEQARQQAMMKTMDPRAADAAEQMARMDQNRKTGKVDPRDVQETIDSRFPQAAQHLALTKGVPLHERYAQMKALGIPGFDDPKSEFSQAAAARMREIYGTGMSDELYPGVSPKELAGPRPTEGLRSWLRPIDYLSSSIEAGLRNAASGHMALDPEADFQRRSAAANWYNSIK